MTEPALDLSQAKRLMEALYLPGDFFYVLSINDHKNEQNKRRGAKEKPETRQRSWTYHPGSSPADITEFARERRWGVAISVGVFEPPRPDRRARRVQEQLHALSAFGIDIDGKNLEALVKGATGVDEVIPEVVKRLKRAGLSSYALVRSGRGLHVWVFIQRVEFTTNEERTRAKETWYRLAQLLGGATDRFDLSSFLRLPGTLNWKGEPRPVRFVEEHTLLDRPRHRLEEVAKAVANQPRLPSDKTVGGEKKKGRSRNWAASGRVLDGEQPRHDPWDLHVLNVALKLTPGLVEARRVSMDAPVPKKGKLDRSKNDFGYACHLLNLGLAEDVVRAELAASAKGQESGEAYVDSTFRAAMSKVHPTKHSEQTATWETSDSSRDALFTGLEAPARLRLLNPNFSAREDSPASPTTDQPPTVAVALARPGQGKTWDVVDWLSGTRIVGTGRLGVCGSMVRELLRHEYVINTRFPRGHQDGWENDLPEDHDRLWEMLPAKVKERIDSNDPSPQADGSYRPLWTLEKLKGVVQDPAAFYINSRRPDQLDEGLAIGPLESKNEPPPWAASWDDPVLRQPRAVLKFKGRPDLCLANRSAKQLRDRRTCLECDFSSCRANMNGKYGGSKTYWSDAPFALLTHQAFETHSVVKPSLNSFDSMVFDELPALVYRYPKLRVSPLAVRKRRAVGWNVSPIDIVIETVEANLTALDLSDPKAASKRGALETLLVRLQVASDKLKKKASDLMHKTLEGDLKRGMVQVDRLEPLLTHDEFATLVTASNLDADDEAKSEDDVPSDPSLKLLNALSELRDFCGSNDLDVFMEVDFDSDGHGSLWICRPVNGWPDLLTRPDGSPRPTVLLDASAGMDPRYLLVGQWESEEVPDGEYPNTTLVLTSERSVSKKKVNEIGAADLAELLVRQVAPYVDRMVDPSSSHRGSGPPRVLVVTAKREIEEALQKALAPFESSGKLPFKFTVEHFGGLRGRNDFRDFDAVYMTHTHRYDAAYYYGLELLLRQFGEPFDRQWVPKSEWHRKHSTALRHRAQAADIYQDALRIGIRSDPTRRAVIFLPTSEAGLVVRVLRLLRGAKLVLPGGEVVSSPLPPQPDQQAEQPAAAKTGRGLGKGWVAPRYDLRSR